MRAADSVLEDRLLLLADLEMQQACAAEARRCRVCGCDNNHACVGPDGRACHCVEWDLCSAHAGKARGK